MASVAAVAALLQPSSAKFDLLEMLKGKQAQGAPVETEYTHGQSETVEQFRELMAMDEENMQTLLAHGLLKQDSDGDEEETGDGDDEKQETDKEPEVCVVETVKRGQDQTAFEVDLTFHSDYTRSVQMMIGDDPQPFQLLPDPGMDQIIVLRTGCSGCYSLGDSHKFSNTCPSPNVNTTITAEINWFYQLHAYETNVTGQHYHEKVCLAKDETFDKCANMHIFGAEKN